jgi:hypothetical protein
MTRDIDILSCGFLGEEAEIVRRITAIAAVEVDDGVTFDPSTLKAVPIREEDEYHGLRLVMVATIARARLKLQLNVSFGDPVTLNRSSSPTPSSSPRKFSSSSAPFLSSPGARLGDDGRRGQRREARPLAAGYATTDGVEIRRSGLQNDMFVLHFSHTKPVDSFTWANPAELQDRYQQLLETEASIELSAAERTLVASSMPPARFWEATTLERRSQAQRSWQEQASPPTSSASAERSTSSKGVSTPPSRRRSSHPKGSMARLTKQLPHRLGRVLGFVVAVPVRGETDPGPGVARHLQQRFLQHERDRPVEAPGVPGPGLEWISDLGSHARLDHRTGDELLWMDAKGQWAGQGRGPLNPCGHTSPEQDVRISQSHQAR